MSKLKLIFLFAFLCLNLRGWSQTNAKTEACTLSEESFGLTEIYRYVDSMPQYPGGMNLMMQFIAENLKVPVDFISWNSKVITQFVVDTNGQLTDKKIIKGLNDDLNKAVLDMLDKMPPWVPGRCQGRLAPVVFILPVIIELQ